VATKRKPKAGRGDVTEVWTIDDHAYDTSPEYRDRVHDFVHRHLPDASVFDAAVFEYSTGERELITSSWMIDGQFTQDEHGRPDRVMVRADLDPDEVLP
jgi:hypothetical protein